MPREYRDIVFSNDEVVSALSAYDRLQAEQAIGCDISELSVEQHDGLQVMLRVNGGDGGRTIPVPPEMLRSALVRFCIENNIIIPRRSKKSTYVGKKTATLRIRME